MDTLTFHLEHANWRYISFSRVDGLRVTVLNDTDREQTYDLDRRRAIELWKWLSDALTATESVPAEAAPFSVPF